MKVEEQLVFFAALYGVPAKVARAEVREWLDRFRVPEDADRKAGGPSKGNPQTGAIIDRGRLLASGPTADVRRMTGKRVVRLGVADDPDLPWLTGMAGVTIT